VFSRSGAQGFPEFQVISLNWSEARRVVLLRYLPSRGAFTNTGTCLQTLSLSLLAGIS
jgi:hypothetical protein